MGLIDRLKTQLEKQFGQLRAQLRAKLADTAPPALDGPPPVIHQLDGGGIEVRTTSDTSLIAAVRKAIEDVSRKSGLDDNAADDVGLCVNEALANVIRHAYGGATDKPIVLTAKPIDGGGTTVTIRDWGNGYDPSHLMDREHDPLTPGGIGLICMKRMMNEVKYEKQPEGMLLTMTRTTSHSPVGYCGLPPDSAGGEPSPAT